MRTGLLLTPEPSAVEVAGITLAFDEGAPVLHELDLSIGPGEVLALLGPSGCGKTTLLRVVAGLEVPSAGSVTVGDDVLTAPGVTVAPERRGVGMVFQDWALFPHLSVAENVGFGLPRGERRDSERITETLALVGLDGLGDRSPSTLSGGQQQRVALGRALARRPGVLLLDEPFSNLDATLRTRVRSDVHRLLGEVGVTTVLVTHDRDEAFVLGDRVAVMLDGRIVQVGTPEAVYREPRDLWVAGFVGEAVVLDATVGDSLAETSLGPLDVLLPTGAASGPHHVQVLLRPEHLTIDVPTGGGGADGAAGVVELVEFSGPLTAYEVSVSGRRLRVTAAGRPRHGTGDSVVVGVRGDGTPFPSFLSDG